MTTSNSNVNKNKLTDSSLLHGQIQRDNRGEFDVYVDPQDWVDLTVPAFLLPKQLFPLLPPGGFYFFMSGGFSWFFFLLQISCRCPFKDKGRSKKSVFSYVSHCGVPLRGNNQGFETCSHTHTPYWDSFPIHFQMLCTFCRSLEGKIVGCSACKQGEGGGYPQVLCFCMHKCISKSRLFSLVGHFLTFFKIHPPHPHHNTLVFFPLPIIHTKEHVNKRISTISPQFPGSSFLAQNHKSTAEVGPEKERVSRGRTRGMKKRRWGSCGLECNSHCNKYEQWTQSTVPVWALIVISDLIQAMNQMTT